MKTKYDELTLTHNLSGVILPTYRYKHIYSKGAYSIPPVIILYDDPINRDATRTEVHQVEGKYEARKNDCTLYETAEKVCKNLIMELVDETWYKELENPDMFYTNFTDLKLLHHLTKFCLGFHTVDDMDIPQLMKTLFTNADGILQSINAMEAAERKSKMAKLVIQDKYMRAVVLKLLLEPGNMKPKRGSGLNSLMTNKHIRRGKKSQGGVCGEETVQSSKVRRGQNVWWFRSKIRTQADISKRV